MSSPPNQTTTAADLGAVVEAIRGARPVPRHDAREPGRRRARLAARDRTSRCGRSARTASCSSPAPRRSRASTASWRSSELQRELPADAAERTLVAVDCANESRLGADPAVLHQAPFTLNIDHHHDNSRFGDVNLVDAEASSTGEVLRDVFGELGVELTPELAEPLYVALVTDTGRFQYANTTPKALRLAAELVEAGRGRAQGLPGRLRERPVREAEAARAGARAGAGVRGRRARRLVPAPRRLRRGRRRRAVLGGDHRLPARGRGRRTWPR